MDMWKDDDSFTTLFPLQEIEQLEKLLSNRYKDTETKDTPEEPSLSLNTDRLVPSSHTKIMNISYTQSLG